MDELTDTDDAGAQASLPRLAAAGRITGAVLAALGTLALVCAGLAAFAQASGLVHGEITDSAMLAAYGLVCIALAAVAAGLSRAARRVGAAETRRAAALDVGVLVTRHTGQGEVSEVMHRSGAFAAVPPEALAGMCLFERVLVADRPAFLAAVRTAAYGSAPVTCELRMRCEAADAGAPDFLPLEARCVPVGEAVEVTFRPAGDVRLKAEAKARVEAEQASAAKSRFLAAMSHELRTPLNAILGFSELLATDAGAALPAERKEGYARIIHESGQHLLGLVNDILDLSRVEAGAYTLERESVAVGDLVSECAEMVALEATRAGVRVRLSMVPRLPPIEADRRALKQIVLNLVSNAVKFTPRGGRVQVAVRAGSEAVLIRVRDTGPGMHADDVARLGEPFFQAGDCTQRARGSGLGLAVVKGLVQLHGGSFAVESAPGHGTSVSIRLPLVAPAQAEGEASPTGSTVASFPLRPAEGRLIRRAEVG